MLHRLLSLIFCLFALAAMLQSAGTAFPAHPLPQPDKFEIELRISKIGAHQHLGGMLGAPYPMSKEPPTGLKKGPEDPSARYCLLPTRVTNKGVLVAVTESADSTSGKLWIDLNGDGDLTNDPIPPGRDAQWALRGPVAFQAERDLVVGQETIRLGFFRYTNKFAKGQIALEDQNNPLFIHREDVLEGQVKINHKLYPVILFDRGVQGRFEYAQGPDFSELAPGKAILYIDRDNDGKLDGKYEAFDLAKSFAVGGASLELESISPDGRKIILKDASKPVAEIPLPPTAIGRNAPSFQSGLLGKGEICFPEEFKGKVVLISFWATWCAPCIGHMPELVATRDRLKSKGVEVVGVCLDQESAREQALITCKKQGANWPQAFDGLGTQGKIAQAYGVTTLPAYIVVDGTTGKVLAPPDEVKAIGINPTLNRIVAIREVLSGK